MTKNVFLPKGTETSNTCYFGSQLCEVDGRMEDIEYHYFDYDLAERSDILSALDLGQLKVHEPLQLHF